MNDSQAKPTKSATFVLVHGAWAGGWDWLRVMDALTANGHRVYAPALSSLGNAPTSPATPLRSARTYTISSTKSPIRSSGSKRHRTPSHGHLVGLFRRARPLGQAVSQDALAARLAALEAELATLRGTSAASDFWAGQLPTSAPEPRREMRLMALVGNGLPTDPRQMRRFAEAVALCKGAPSPSQYVTVTWDAPSGAPTKG